MKLFCQLITIISLLLFYENAFPSTISTSTKVDSLSWTDKTGSYQVRFTLKYSNEIQQGLFVECRRIGLPNGKVCNEKMWDGVEPSTMKNGKNSIVELVKGSLRISDIDNNGIKEVGYIYTKSGLTRANVDTVTYKLLLYQNKDKYAFRSSNPTQFPAIDASEAKFRDRVLLESISTYAQELWNTFLLTPTSRRIDVETTTKKSITVNKPLKNAEELTSLFNEPNSTNRTDNKSKINVVTNNLNTRGLNSYLNKSDTTIRFEDKNGVNEVTFKQGTLSFDITCVRTINMKKVWDGHEPLSGKWGARHIEFKPKDVMITDVDNDGAKEVCFFYKVHDRSTIGHDSTTYKLFIYQDNNKYALRSGDSTKEPEIDMAKAKVKTVSFSISNYAQKMWGKYVRGDSLPLTPIKPNENTIVDDELLPPSPYKRLAVFIATNTYNDYPTLTNPVIDAEKIASELFNYYSFDTLIIRNPTIETVEETLLSLREQLDKKTQLLLYFTGHGLYKKEYNSGYLVFSNSKSENKDKLLKTYISYNDLTIKILNQIKVQHLLLIIDACFSGAFRLTSMKGSMSYSLKTNKDIYYERLSKVSRTALTSGGYETVTDGSTGGNSPFASQLLRGLGDSGNSMTKGLYASTLFDWATKIAGSQPQLITFEGDGGGDFPFAYQPRKK